MLVAAVLGPEQREHRELEVVRLASEKAPDPLELPVRQPERAVHRLFCDLRQGLSVSPPSGRPDRARSRRAEPGSARARPLAARCSPGPCSDIVPSGLAPPAAVRPPEAAR